MFKKIEFITDDKNFYNFVPCPEPAKKFIPDWYKKSHKFYNGNKPEFINGHPNSSIKSCIPIFDAMSSGYIQKTWCEIFVENNNGKIYCWWAGEGGPDIMGVKEEGSMQKYPILEGYNPTPFYWNRGWSIKTPKNYSVLITHPLYYLDLPFICVSGIVDSDKYHLTGRSPVFFIKNSFSGIIPIGTPMYQMIPIKRENWKSFTNFKTMKNQKFELRKRFIDRYKKEFWQKKHYE